MIPAVDDVQLPTAEVDMEAAAASAPTRGLGARPPAPESDIAPDARADAPVRIFGSTPSDNPFLGTSKVKRAVLQYAFVSLCVYLAYSHGINRIKTNVIYAPEKLFNNHQATTVLKWLAGVFALGLSLAPFFLWKRLPPTPAECADFTNDTSFLGKIGVVIPCHKSRDEIGAVLERCLLYFKPEHIVVADNANFDEPPDDTAAVVKAVSSRIRYLYIPQGHKTRALLHGTFALPSSVQYVMHLDDDTLLSEKMVFDASHFADPAVSGVTFGIRMSGDALVSRCVDWEFVLFSIYRTFEADRATATFCHGIIGLWRRDRWERHLATHPAMPYGEDAWIGCDTITNNERIAGELRCWVSTYAPSRLLPAGLCFQCGAGGREQGYGASSIWKQRAMRWFTNAPRRLNYRFAQLLHYRASTLGRGIWFRFFMWGHLNSVAFYLLTPLVFAAKLYADPVSGLFSVGKWFAVIAMARFIHSLWVMAAIALRDRSLLPKVTTALFYPAYMSFLDVAFMYGHWRSILWYVPFWPHQRHMPQQWAAKHQDVVESSRRIFVNVSTSQQDAEGLEAGAAVSVAHEVSKALAQSKTKRSSQLSLTSMVESSASSSSQASSNPGSLPGSPGHVYKAAGEGSSSDAALPAARATRAAAKSEKTALLNATWTELANAPSDDYGHGV